MCDLYFHIVFETSHGLKFYQCRETAFDFFVLTKIAECLNALFQFTNSNELNSIAISHISY